MPENKFIHDHGDGNYHTHENEFFANHETAAKHESAGNQETGSDRHVHEHSHKQTKTVINRLSRAGGHLEAVKRMVEDGRDCSEVLIQIAAVRAALNSTAKIILRDHIEHCIVDAVESGDKKTLEELNHAIDMLMK